MSKGKVYLVGAGPGDAGLITVKGLEAIREADVIIYDHLASDGLLNESKSGSEWIFAGKMAGNHHLKQDEIIRLLIDKALQGLRVVRLKGGDPFIFGRGGEEAMALAEAGVSFEVIPGVSSAYAAAAYCGIPVTHRHVASSFHVITGHEDPTKEASVLDYKILAKEEGTLVFLMGLSRLQTICHMLIKNGKPPETAAAVISNGTTARQRVVTASLEQIAECAAQAELKPPAVLVVGDVAALQSQISWQQRGPLSGRRILVTASGETAERLGKMITQLGGEPIPVSLIEVRPIPEVRVAPVLANAADDAWLVFTSRNGVNLFFKQLQREGVDRRILGQKKIAVMGGGTREALLEHGYYADLVPEQSCSASLAGALCRVIGQKEHQEVLLFRAQEASPILGECLRKAGIACVDTALYITDHQVKKAELLRRVLKDVDVVTFCSASAVSAFHSIIAGQELQVQTVCIGPVTAQAAADRGIKIDRMAEQYDLSGLVRAICELLDGRGVRRCGVYY